MPTPVQQVQASNTVLTEIRAIPTPILQTMIIRLSESSPVLSAIAHMPVELSLVGCTNRRRRDGNSTSRVLGPGFDDNADELNREIIRR
jgi:hypothetical protein